MESMLSCLLCLCAISIPVIQGSAGHFQVRMPNGHAPQQIDITPDMTIRELRALVAGSIGMDTETIVMRYGGQLLSDGDDALLASAGVAVESVVDVTVKEDYQQMLFDEYQLPFEADYRKIFAESIASHLPVPAEEKRKIDLLVRLLLQQNDDSDSDSDMYEYVSGQIYSSVVFLSQDCSLVEHFFDEFPDITRDTLVKNTLSKDNACAFSLSSLFFWRRTGITLKLVEQIYDAFEGYERDIHVDRDGIPLEWVLRADRTRFVHGDEGRQQIVEFLRSKGAVESESATSPRSVRRLIQFQGIKKFRRRQ